MARPDYSDARKVSPFHRMWNGTLDALRDHPIFDVPDPAARPQLLDKSSPANGDGSLKESDRAANFAEETLRLFRRRTHLITLTAIGTLLPFSFLFGHFAPEARVEVAIMHALMLGVCAGINWLSRHAKTLPAARFWAVTAYMVFGLTAAAVMAACKDPKVNAFSGHPQIMMSLLFVPFSAPQTAFCAFLTCISYALGLSASMGPDEMADVYWPQVISLAFTGLVLTFMAHLQSLTRLRAFNAAFDLALSVVKGVELSNLDLVTGGFNRRHISNILELELARATRFRQPLALILFDLDNFKPVNDTLGHAAGDVVLKEVLIATASTLRSLDTVGRFGGDEFAVILPGTGPDAALYAANRLKDCIRGHMNNTFGSDSLQAKVTISLGLACFQGADIPTVEDALEKADEFLYAAKRAGKDRIIGG